MTTFSHSASEIDACMQNDVGVVHTRSGTPQAPVENNFSSPSTATSSTSVPFTPFIGMHDADFYAAVAKELRVDAPVLHSVIHTHHPPGIPPSVFRQEKSKRQVGSGCMGYGVGKGEKKTSNISGAYPISLRNGRAVRAAPSLVKSGEGSLTSGNENTVVHAVADGGSVPAIDEKKDDKKDEEEEDGEAPSQRSHSLPSTFCSLKSQLEEEISQINNSLHVWKVNRLAEQLAKEEGNQRCHEMEVQMKQRMLFREKIEQDRALRRIDQLVGTLLPKLSKTLEDSFFSCDGSRPQSRSSNAKSVERCGLQYDGKERKSLTGANSELGRKEKRKTVKFVPEIPQDPLLRLELKKHDEERDKRLISRKEEMNKFTSSWLVERSLQQKYEARACCEREHYLQYILLKFEEEKVRRQLNEELWLDRCIIGFFDDEREFRERIRHNEVEKWKLMEREEKEALETLLRSPTPEPEEEEEGGEEMQEEEMGEENEHEEYKGEEEEYEEEEDYEEDYDEDYDDEEEEREQDVSILSPRWPTSLSLDIGSSSRIEPRSPLGLYGEFGITHEELERENMKHMNDEDWDEDPDPPTLFFVLTSEMIGE